MNIFNYDTYVFDFDGVIVDSEKFHWLSYNKATSETITYEKYCEINHSITGPYFRDYLTPEIMQSKDKYYEEYIKDIPLKKGFEEFYNKLIKLGKNIYVVTNTSKEILNKFSKRFKFLNTIPIISDCKKPNHEGYMSIPQYDPLSIIAFEDSYRGYYAATKAIFTVILVNDSDYVYYNIINSQNAFENFLIIPKINYTISNKAIYISSKTHHRDKWISLKNEGYNIVASWILNNTPKELLTKEDKEILCHNFINDIKICDFGIFYSEFDDVDPIGSLIEFGIMTAFEKPIYIMGTNIFENELFSYINKNTDFITYSSKYNIAENIIKICIKDSPNYISFIEKKIVNKPIINDKYLDYVAIIASGEGSRLMPLTKNIPKLLVSFNDRSILNHIVEYWIKYTKKFIIVINANYNNIVKFYLDLMNIDYEIINVNSSKGQENSYTIHKSLYNEKFKNKKILITWCDIFPVSEIPLDIFNDNIIFTYKNYGRYDASDNTIIKKPYGNIIGIYYFPNFKNIEIFEPYMDICDCYLNHYDTFKVYEINDLIDIGDMTKLDSLIQNKNQYITRYFNSITNTSNNTLIKKSLCPYGDTVLLNEMNFYRHYHYLDTFPKIIKYGLNYYEMENINGITAHTYFKSSTFKEQVNLIKELLLFIQTFHSNDTIPVSKNQLLNDIDIEFRLKVNKRLKNVSVIINEFNYIKTVNGIEISHSIKYIKENLYNKVQNYFKNKNEYQTIHGDPHMSNILKGDKLYFIDPRGYFGTTKLFGLPEYDIGKIVYSLSGFDYFNSDAKMHFYIDKTNIIVDINNSIDLFINLFNEPSILIDMTILHWFGLADYNRLNIHKCVSAYFYGIYLYHIYNK
jgi:beta-phosphoglucomutase-like phosphatase (HAD superfamily)